MLARPQARKAALALTCLLALGGVAAADTPARDLFGKVAGPSLDRGGPHAIGSYANGCLAGAVSLPVAGPGWQVLRPSRNRTYGTPTLIAWLNNLIARNRAAGQPALLIGDVAQPRGGPMTSGHASHMIGLDVDIWLTPKTGASVPESFEPPSMIAPGSKQVDPARFGPWQAGIIALAAASPPVDRIFVAPGIKAALCSRYPGQPWLRKVRPWFGHDSHFHVRLACPPGETACVPQAPPPPGDGCGQELSSWFAPPPPGPARPAKPKPPLTLAGMPAPCTAVLKAP